MSLERQSTFVVSSVLFLIAVCASAQNPRSAVSVGGSDINPCTLASPCRSFGTAVAHTNAGGEVIALDSGGYGGFTISASISVIGAPGVYAALTVTTGDAIVVNAGSGDNVSIRGLNMTVLGSATYGIYAQTFGNLTVANCSVQGSGVGYSAYSILGSAGASATVIDSIARDAANGFVIYCSGALIRAIAEHNSGYGLWAQAGFSAITVSAVDFAGVANANGVVAWGSSSQTTLNLDRALLCNSAGAGVLAINQDSLVRVKNSTITDNGTYGFDQVNNGSIVSMKNNMVEGNTSGDSNGVIAAITGK